ncbi:MAG: hypothetical protein C3F13_06840 [Anaerolineales bacterium]|nr:hypothetical protein [Anaerolineae bacterium]PWB54464.1 MAG: hypothetical protein C3F13_06840 [Anaerolineales bacterium]
MPCLFALFAGMFPRLADIFIWIARPNQFLLAFNGKWWWPVLGIVFLPFTTLMWFILSVGAGGINGFDWFWVILAVFLDLSHYAHTVYNNRNAIPGYTPAA